jgi:sugar-specific transcriptional regulator TrmB
MAAIASTLEKLGLSDGEIRVYTALAQLGTSTVGPLVERSKITSSKVYIVLDKLIDKGLATYIIKEKTRYYQATEPVSLIEYAERKEDQIRQTKEDLKDIIQQIHALRAGLPESSARIFKGYRGLYACMNIVADSIPENGVYRFFSRGYGEDEYLKRFFKKLISDLQKRHVRIRGIANIVEKKLYNEYYSRFGYDMRYTAFGWPSDITITDKYVVIFVWDKKEPLLYLLESAVLGGSYLKFFDELWSAAKR